MKAIRTAYEALTLLVLAGVPAGLCVATQGLRVQPLETVMVDLGEGEVTLQDVVSWGPRVLWVDARPDDAFAENHVPGALPLTFENWEVQLFDLLDVVQAEQRLVVYCGSASCGTSREVAVRLREVIGSVASVYVLHGGWDVLKGFSP